MYLTFVCHFPLQGRPTEEFYKLSKQQFHNVSCRKSKGPSRHSNDFFTRHDAILLSVGRFSYCLLLAEQDTPHCVHEAIYEMSHWNLELLTKGLSKPLLPKAGSLLNILILSLFDARMVQIPEWSEGSVVEYHLNSMYVHIEEALK